MTTTAPYTSACRCGQVALEAAGAPILTAACYCDSCRLAARGFEAAPGAPQVLNRDGGVDYSLFRKDRVRVTKGGKYLQAHRLKDKAPSRRVVASCCQSPMFVDFAPGHWLTLYRDRLPDDAPPVEMAMMTGDLPADHARPKGLPAYAGRPAKFMFRLLASFAAMGFRKPKLDF